MNMRKTFAFVAIDAMALISGVASAAANPLQQDRIISLDGHCDILHLFVTPPYQAKMNQYCRGVSGQTGVGVGMLGKVTGVSPKDLTIGENYSEGSPGTVYLWNIQYPLKTGRGWSIFSTADGVNFTPVDSGTYTLGTAETARFPHEGPPAIPTVQK